MSGSNAPLKVVVSSIDDISVSCALPHVFFEDRVARRLKADSAEIKLRELLDRVLLKGTST